MADNSGKRRMSKREEYVKKSLQIQQKQKYAQKQKNNTDTDSKPVQLADMADIPEYDSNANRQLSKLKLEMDEMRKKIDQMQALIINPQQTSSVVAEQMQEESLTESDINDALDDVLNDMKPDEIKQMNDIFDEKSICTTNDADIVMQQPMQQKTIWLIVSEPITDKITFHVHLMGKNSDVLSSTQFKLFVTQSGFETFSFGVYYAHIEHTQFCTTEYSSRLFTKIKLIKTTSSPFSVETISKTMNVESDGNCLFLPKLDNNRKDMHQYILDTTTKETFESYKKHTYYNSIACAFIPQLITTTEIAPCTLLGIMVQLYVYLSGHNFNSHIFEIYLLLPSYNIINNWTEASKLLALIGVDMKLKVLASETDIQYNAQDTDDTVLRELFKKITDTHTQKFGAMQTILDNIGKIYMHDIDQCQNVSFHLQAKYHSIKQCHYLLWYNLLCCVKENTTRNRTVCVSMNPIQRDMLTQLREIVELDNRLPKRAFPLVDVWRRKVMIYKGTTFEEFINVIDDAYASSIQDTYNFIAQCIQQIKRILAGNFGLWIKFIGKIFDLLLQTPYQKLEEFIVSLIEMEFVPNITNYTDDETFYDFCMSEKYHCMFCKICI